MLTTYSWSGMGVNSHLCANFLNTLFIYYFFFLKSLEALQADQINSTQGYAKNKQKKQKNTQNTTNKEDLISYVLSEHQDAACTSLSKNLSKCLFWALHSIKAKCITTIFISKAQHASCRCEAVWIRAPHAHFVLDTTWEKKTQIKNILVSTIPAVPGARTVS